MEKCILPFVVIMALHREDILHCMYSNSTEILFLISTLTMFRFAFLPIIMNKLIFVWGGVIVFKLLKHVV